MAAPKVENASQFDPTRPYFSNSPQYDIVILPKSIFEDRVLAHMPRVGSVPGGYPRLASHRS